MLKRIALIAMLGASATSFAEAREDYKSKLTEAGTNLAIIVGTADYCGGSGQSLFDVYGRSLPHFGLSRGDIDVLLAAIEARRRQAYADISATFANQGSAPGQCPPEVNEKVRNAMQEMENAWYRVVQKETGVDLRQQTPAKANPAQAAQAGSRWSDNHAIPSAPSAPKAPPPQNSSLCVPGQPVSVLYGGSWYPAKVLEGLDSMSTCLVSYDGFGSNWDERVSLKRMRPANAATAPAPQNTSKQATPQAVPTGKYSCYTFDNGQLNYTYTDVQIESGNRYSVGGKGGGYTLSPGGAMTFTGTMANATGKFSIKSSGKPNIDLVFNGDNRASMSCAKSR